MVHARTGAILPHAPLLLPEVATSRADVAVERVRAASREVARVLTGTLVIVSPHARSTGVYVSTRADLCAFGVPRADAVYNVDRELSARVASSWGRPTLEERLDHGILVPLKLLGWEGAVVAIGLAEDEADVAGSARSLAECLADVAGSEATSLVASVNGGAGVTARGPLTELPEGPCLEEELRAALDGDVTSLQELAPRLATEGGSCSLGPLLVFAHLFAGVPSRVLAHEWPYGVGYPVALATART